MERPPATPAKERGSRSLHRTLLVITIVVICVELELYFKTGIPPRSQPNASAVEGNAEKARLDTLPYDPHKENYFLLETRGRSHLSGREACAVEAAARHHPNATVNALMVGRPVFNTSYMTLLRNISNVRVVHIAPDDILEGTCLKSWYWSPARVNSPYGVTQSSDALRVALLWHYGGVYLDTDVIVQRPLSGLRNALGNEPGSSVNNGVLIFDKGHPLLRDCMALMVERYLPFKRTSTGPFLFKYLILKRCPKCVKMGSFVRCICDIHILPDEAFCPIAWWNAKDMTDPKKTPVALKKSVDSLAVHFWNTYTEKVRIYIGKGSLYDMVARKNCPRAYRVAKSVGYF